MSSAAKLPPARQIAYGDHPDQVGNLHLPPAATGRGRPSSSSTAASGARAGIGRLMTPLARDLAGRGIAAWNIEYRRVGQEGGGWPGHARGRRCGGRRTRGPRRIDATRIVTVGHSAGGQLALWLAARHRLPAGAAGAVRALRPCGAVSQAGVVTSSPAPGPALVAMRARRCSAAADDVPERYAVASPAALLPLGSRSSSSTGPRRHRARRPEPGLRRCGRAAGDTSICRAPEPTTST